MNYFLIEPCLKPEFGLFIKSEESFIANKNSTDSILKLCTDYEIILILHEKEPFCSN
jgi:hypothetical protein